MRDSFMFFENFKQVADKLPDEVRLKFYDAITDYVFKGVECEDPIISALVTAFRPSLDKVETRGGMREGAGRPIQNNSKEIKNNQNKSKIIKVNQNNQSFLETETETERENNITPNTNVLPPKGGITFKKPTLEDVRSYCLERNNSVDAERWYDYYTSNGWKVGKNSMKDWRATVRTWEKSSVSAQASRKTANDENECWF